MRKRRRLANKMTIMVCAVLIAVSAFFYAPMDVDAKESLESSVDFISLASDVDLLEFSDSFSGVIGTGGLFYTTRSGFNIPDFILFTDLDDDTLYQVHFFIDAIYEFDASNVLLRDFIVKLGSNRLKTFPDPTSFDRTSFSRFSGSVDFYLYGRDLNSKILNLDSRFLNSESGSLDFVISYSFSDISCVPITGVDSLNYQEGYNAGYSDGEEAGESNGYSSGYSDGYEAGEQRGYDSGYQAGADSVDTQSYYDAGYSAGYDAGYLNGYDTGYDEGYLDGFENGVKDGEITGYEKGYEDALEYYTKGRVSNVPDFSNTGRYYFSGGNSSYDGSNVIPTNYDFVKDNEYNITFDISYSYRFSSLNNISGTPTLYTGDWAFNLCGVDFYFDRGFGTYSFDFVPSTLDNNINLSYGLSALFFPADWSYAYSCTCDFTVLVKNVVITSKTGRSMGEILEDIERQDLNTQHIIQDEFNDVMNGYDSSQGNAVNSDLSTGLNEYETAENSLFATATTGMKDFVFFDFESVPAMVTGMSFVGSIMGSWFNQAGGASGVGIVLSILFSVMLVAMVLGLYRWYQSRGGKK